MNYDLLYEELLKDFSVGNVVLYDKVGVKDFYVFEVGEVTQKALFPIPGSVLALNRDSTQYMGEFRFSIPIMAPEKFLVEHCRRLVCLSEITEYKGVPWDDDVHEWIRSTYNFARYDEQALYCFTKAEGL